MLYKTRILCTCSVSDCIQENKPTDTFSFNMALMFIINLVRLTATSVHIIAIMVLVFAARTATLVIEMPLSHSTNPPSFPPTL